MAEEGYREAKRLLMVADAELTRRGYTASQSSLGDARYYSLPSQAVRIRVATYWHRHDATVDIAITPKQALQCAISDADIRQLVAEAIIAAGKLEVDLADDDDDDDNFDALLAMTPEQVAAALRST